MNVSGLVIIPRKLICTSSWWMAASLWIIVGAPVAAPLILAATRQYSYAENPVYLPVRVKNQNEPLKKLRFHDP